MRLLDIFMDSLEKVCVHFEHGNPTVLGRWPFLALLKAKVELERGQPGLVSLVMAMLAKVAYVDGKASKEELFVVEDLLEFGFALNVPQKIRALELFRKGRASREAFESFAGEYFHCYGRRRALLERMLESLALLALADGPLNDKERQCIEEAARTFELSRERLEEILRKQEEAKAYRDTLAEMAKSKATFRRRGTKVREEGEFCDSAEKFSIHDAHYRALGCKRSDAPARIKSRYRKLVLMYHPDRHAHKELPSEMVEYSVERFRRIQEAFEYVKKEKGFS